jgi:hypothetical protein
MAACKLATVLQVHWYLFVPCFCTHIPSTIVQACNIVNKALSPKNKIGRYLTTQNRVTPPELIRDITMMKAIQHRIAGKAILPEKCQVCTTTAFS